MVKEAEARNAFLGRARASNKKLECPYHKGTPTPRVIEHTRSLF